MSYQQSIVRDLYASPNGVCLAKQTLNQTPTVGGTISFASLRQMKGALHNEVSISSGSLVLPAGYWYYLDASTEFHLINAYSQSAYAKTQWYIGTTPVGTEGVNGMQLSGKDGALFSSDEKCIALIDATGGAVTVTLKINALSVFDAVNTTTHSQYVYGGYGRSVIIQLEAP